LAANQISSKFSFNYNKVNLIGFFFILCAMVHFAVTSN